LSVSTRTALVSSDQPRKPRAPRCPTVAARKHWRRHLPTCRAPAANNRGALVNAALAFEKAGVATDVLRVPHLELPHISDATKEAIVVIALVGSILAGVVRLVVGIVAAIFFGDRIKVIARPMGDLAPEVMDNEDGVPIVKPGEEPTPKQKLAAVAYLLAIAAVVVWLLFLRC
jgi:hypothetical protein